VAYRLDDHWLQVNKPATPAHLDETNQDYSDEIKSRIKEHLDSMEAIEEAEFSEVVLQESPTRIDLYA